MCPFAQGMALGWAVGAGAVALERALAGSTPYPAHGYGRNLDARGLFAVDRPCNLNRSVSLVLIEVDPRVFVFLHVVPRGFASLHMITLLIHFDSTCCCIDLHHFRGRENV